MNWISKCRQEWRIHGGWSKSVGINAKYMKSISSLAYQKHLEIRTEQQNAAQKINKDSTNVNLKGWQNFITAYNCRVS